MFRAKDVRSSVAPAFSGAFFFFFDRVPRDAGRATGVEARALKQVASQCLADMLCELGGGINGCSCPSLAQRVPVFICPR